MAYGPRTVRGFMCAPPGVSVRNQESVGEAENARAKIPPDRCFVPREI
jgi:hypothetical protein